MKPPISWATPPILRGSLRGKRWLLATRSNFFLGSYEPEQTALFEHYVTPGAVVYDIGAHYGYYSLLSSVLAGEVGSVLAFEPSPHNLAFLRHHLRINHLANVRVIEKAVADHVGVAHFDMGGGSGIGHLSEDGKVEVQLTTLDALADELPAPTVMKIDVEGAEMAVFQGGQKTIEHARPIIFLSVHSPELKRDCSAYLKDLGYKLEEILPMELLALPQ